MRVRALFMVGMATFILPLAGWAALIVDPARPITHRVTVQLIETALTNGTSPATIFGNASQRASIEAGIDAVWAQAGIDIDFSLPIVRYDNTFAYQGNGGSRPTSDLGMIISNADTAGDILNPSASVINMFMVNIVPGFGFTSENTANGLANIGDNGISAFVGDNLLTFQGGHDVIAGVIAHEIGHNLGLKHAASGGANVMSPGGTSAQLSAAQISAVFQTIGRNDSVAYIPPGGTGFPLPYSVPVAGDYNEDGFINAADFAVWRNTLGSSTNLAADGNGNQTIDTGDYTIWKGNFGKSAPLGSAEAQSNLAGVPEPATCVLLLSALMSWAAARMVYAS